MVCLASYRDATEKTNFISVERFKTGPQRPVRGYYLLPHFIRSLQKSFLKKEQQNHHKYCLLSLSDFQPDQAKIAGMLRNHAVAERKLYPQKKRLGGKI
jgi:hypothetical protein